MALMEAEVSWIQSLFFNFKFLTQLMSFFVIISVLSPWLIFLFFTPELVLTKHIINVVDMPTLDQLTDILTKAFISCYFSFLQIQAQSG